MNTLRQRAKDFFTNEYLANDTIHWSMRTEERISRYGRQETGEIARYVDGLGTQAFHKFCKEVHATLTERRFGNTD